MVIVDIEKAFDSLSHSFLLARLKKFGFDKMGHNTAQKPRILYYQCRPQKIWIWS